MEKGFYQYMMAYRNRNTLRGDLARDMMHELKVHPEEAVDRIDSEEQFMHYLSVHRACRECTDAARRCWRSYRRATGSVCYQIKNR